MKRLLWKELRERAFWFALWALAVWGTAAFGVGQQFLGKTNTFSVWIILGPFCALLAGLAAYGSELKGERATFVYSRAITWKQLLAAKVIPGLLIAIITPLLGALICRLVVLPQYLPFATPENLLRGAVEFTALMTITYLLGLSCSVVFPGVAGGLLTLGIWCVVGVALIAMFISPNGADPSWQMQVSLLVIPLTLGMVLTRFGITLTATARARRFFVPALLFAGVLAGVLAMPGVNTYLATKTNINYFVRMNPSATWAYVTRDRDGHLLRVTGDQSLAVDFDPINSAWMSNSCLLTTEDTVRDAQSQYSLLFHYLDRDSMRTWQITGMGSTYEIATRVSPDERRVLIVSRSGLGVLNLDNGEHRAIAITPKEKYRADLPNRSQPYRQSWWQDNRTVGYLDPVSGARVLVPLGE